MDEKEFEMAAQNAKLASEEAERIGRKDFMALSLNLEAKSKMKNKKLKKLERLVARMESSGEVGKVTMLSYDLL